MFWGKNFLGKKLMGKILSKKFLDIYIYPLLLQSQITMGNWVMV